ncbi:PREDICTED: anion exchange protein 3-like [Priapulus caudatus]|uniref:Anion exchange protein 3-like n=1 Tax=Priapulus caudatus TaxID=37621 RepID=A0ABM1E5F9_PRICU|nr:PREDICTED: anion exchange protein 3-like [Priapulus caudatus]
MSVCDKGDWRRWDQVRRRTCRRVRRPLEQAPLACPSALLPSLLRGLSRSASEEGMVLLDMHLLDYPSILDRVVNSMLLNDQVRKQDVEPLIHTLLLKHKWAGDNKFLPKNISFKNLAAIDLRKVSVVSLLDKRKPDSSRSSRKITNVPLYRDVEQGDKVSVTGTNQFPEQPAPSKQTSELLKRIPEGAEGAAILVGTVSYLVKPTTVFVRLAQGTSMPALLEIDIPVRFLFILLGPATDGLDYHQIGRSIGALMVNQTFQGVAYTADGGQDLKVAINNFLDTSVVLPPGHWDKKTLVGIAEMQREEMEKQAVRKAKRQRHAAEKEDKQQEPVDPLSRTGRLFGGMINDMRHRYPQYKSDVVDAINAQCIATTIFIFFACLSPAITFGTILGEETEQWMGVTEFLAVFCQSQDVEFLVFRWWVGSWILLFTLIVVALDGSALVRYFTRFTEEIFATLISFIFIFSCFKKLYYMYKYHPLLSLDDYCLTLNDSDPYDNETAANSSSYYADPINQPNTALIGTILMLGTFLLAYCLKLFRNSQFLGRSARRALGDFGVPIAIAMMTLIDIVLLHDTYTELDKEDADAKDNDDEEPDFYEQTHMPI